MKKLTVPLALLAAAASIAAAVFVHHHKAPAEVVPTAHVKGSFPLYWTSVEFAEPVTAIDVKYRAGADTKHPLNLVTMKLADGRTWAMTVTGRTDMTVDPKDSHRVKFDPPIADYQHHSSKK